ncbi:MAG: NAD-binding protein [Candidatus Cloacimonetes bacterium]|nr:NAD-binding protein [Candidatus Cloacimonadota bacterium]
MNILIVGGGKVVYFVARSFQSKGHQTTIINKNIEECRWLSRRLKGVIVHGDGTDPQVLKDTNTIQMDAILAITPHDEDNLIICQIAKLNFGIRRTLAFVNDPDNEEMFKKLGISAAFSTTHMISNIIEQRTAYEDIIDLSSMADGKVIVTEILISDDSPACNKKLQDIDLPENSLIACVIRDDTQIIPRGSNVIQKKDKVIVITLPENHGEVIKILTGDVVE